MLDLAEVAEPVMRPRVVAAGARPLRPCSISTRSISTIPPDAAPEPEPEPEPVPEPPAPADPPPQPVLQAARPGAGA